MKSFIRKIFSDIIGLVFLVSAITKLMDPVGTGLIVDAYLGHFYLDFLRPASKWIGEILSMTEAAVSIGILTGTFRRFFAWLATAMIIFFTGISVWLVIANPDMECGCFGKAIPLTHIQTLIKNVALCVCCIPAFVPYRNLGKARGHRYAAFGAGLVLMLFFSIVSILQQPIVEYSEFKPSHTIVSDNEGEDPWEYPVLPVWDKDGNDCSDLILDGDVALLSFYKPQSVDKEELNAAASFVQDALNAGYTPCILSSGDIEIPGEDAFYSDYKKLITLNRSNGGATLLRDGYIIRKRNAGHYFSYDELDEIINKDAVEAYIDSAIPHTLALQGFILVFLIIIILV